MKLTAKQESFCRNIALKGMNQSDAYRDAFNVSNNKADYIRKEASKLVKNHDITTTISNLKASLQQKTMQKFVKLRDELLKELETIKIKSFQDNDKRIVIDCIKEQAKLLGYYEDIVTLRGDKNAPLEGKISIEFVKKKKA